MSVVVGRGVIGLRRRELGRVSTLSRTVDSRWGSDVTERSARGFYVVSVRDYCQPLQKRWLTLDPRSFLRCLT